MWLWYIKNRAASSYTKQWRYLPTCLSSCAQHIPAQAAAAEAKAPSRPEQQSSPSSSSFSAMVLKSPVVQKKELQGRKCRDAFGCGMQTEVFLSSPHFAYPITTWADPPYRNRRTERKKSIPPSPHSPALLLKDRLYDTCSRDEFFPSSPLFLLPPPTKRGCMPHCP